MAHILVIDDQEHIRTIMKEFFTIDQHEVDLAESGTDGLKLVGLNVYDLVITDVVMPHHDGFEVILALKRQVPPVKVIAMTGGGAMLDIGDVLDASLLLGADRVVSKPLDFAELQAVVNEVLDICSVNIP
ncbi:MAG TPA: response regulator [Desulfuromonadales bacterium]|nr:response regulator [Desulfuromonadales bacterium]